MPIDEMLLSQLAALRSKDAPLQIVGMPILESDQGMLLRLSLRKYVLVPADRIVATTPASDGRIGLLVSGDSLLQVTKFETVEKLTKSVPFRIDEENFAHPKTLRREGDPKEGSVSDQKKLTAGATLEGSCKVFKKSCEGGGSQANNCAHYLSNSMIKAGINDLTNSLTCVELRCNWNDSCSNLGGNTNFRVVRARNLRCWFAKKAASKSTSLAKNSGFWATYQERASDGQGHVAVIDTNSWRYYGTGWFPDWKTQEYYQW